MAVQVQTTLQQGQWLKFEEVLHNFSRDQVTLAAGQSNLLSGTVLGQSVDNVTSVTVTPKVGNTGNGVFTADATTPVLAGAQVGTYTIRCTAAATNSGTFRVFDPNGFSLGDVVVGATFADQIKFSIADGATDFVVGDQFSFVVAAGTGRVAALNLAGTDGTQNVAGVLIYDTDATSADAQCAMLARHAVVSDYGLIWPNGISGTQKAAAVAQLKAKGILVRTGA